MISLFNIRTIARFEAKTLLRSWFFRIFAGIAVLFLLMFNMFGVASIGDGGWQGRFIPSAVPYFNMWILNIAQSIIAVFLSADFLGRDKKLDTTEAFYVRSMSNMEYVIGKTLGILKVFLVLNLIVLLIGLLFSIIGNEFSLNWSSFIIYPLLISLPTLVFVLGLSFFVMTLIRNQAITFVLLLGFIALSLFYLENKWFGLFDFLGFFMPFMRSDYTGFGNEMDLLLVRSGFLLLGLFFILATVWRLPRLEQQKYARLSLLSGMVIFLFSALGMMSFKAVKDYNNQTLRAAVNNLNEALTPSVYVINNYNLQLDHQGGKIFCDVTMNVASSEETSEDLVMALNPGLAISQISIDGKEVSFDRQAHLLTIKNKDISKNGFELNLHYSGTINDRAMFPEVTDERLLSLNRLDPLVANKQFSFIENNYLLLTREANWYPVVASQLYWTAYPFATMDLTVKAKPGMTVISQGLARQKADGIWKFKPDHPLNAYSVVIGRYEKLSTVVDSVEITLYHHPKHDFFKPYFTEIQDTAAHIIKSIKDDFERQLGINYPFKQFSVVESPINMYSYLRNWSLATENVMPGMVLMPECGGGTWQNDLSRMKSMVERQGRRNNEELSEKDKQVEILKSFIGDNFIRPRRFFFGRRSEGERNVENWGRYQVFPNYFSYVNSVSEEGYPLLTIALENYLHERLSESRPTPFGGLTSNDEVILKLRDRSLSDLIKEEDIKVLGNVFASKGNQLLSNLKVHSGEDAFDRQLDQILHDNEFKNINIADFSHYMSKLVKADFSDIYNNWLNDEKSPAYIFGNVDVWEIKEGNRIRYFMKVPVKNNGDEDGIISFTIREGERRGGRRGRFRSGFMTGAESTNKKNYMVPSGETVEIGFMLDDVPRDVTVDTYLARNIPSSQRLETNDVISDQRQVDFFEGPRSSGKTLKYAEDFEIIVDNEDEGCDFVNTGESRTIKDWWLSRRNQEEEGETYGMIRFWNMPVKWKPVAGQQFFGEYLKSGLYKRKGIGEGYVSWTGNIEDPGNYDVYVYVPDIRIRFRRGGRNYQRDYHYTVDHDDGTDEVEIAVTQDNNGWLYLGEYYFSEGAATVKLSDQTKADFVLADAVKWVKK